MLSTVNNITKFIDIKNKFARNEIKIPRYLNSMIYKIFQLKRFKPVKITPLMVFNEIKKSLSPIGKLNGFEANIFNSLQNNQSFDVFTENLNDLRSYKNTFRKYNSYFNTSTANQLFIKAVYGYTLDKYFKVYQNHSVHHGSYESWEMHCKSTLKISGTYLRKLRWLGRIAYKFQAFRYLNLSLKKLYSMKRIIDVLLYERRYHDEQMFLKEYVPL